MSGSPHHLYRQGVTDQNTTCTLCCWSHIRRFQLFGGLRQKKTDGSLMVRSEIRRENQLRLVVDIRLDLPKGAEWMIRGAYTPSFRIKQHPLEDPGQCLLFKGFLYVPGGWPWDFWNWSINSISMISSLSLSVRHWQVSVRRLGVPGMTRHSGNMKWFTWIQPNIGGSLDIT